jgi:hypothetical protein
MTETLTRATLPIANERELATALRERGLPGQRSMTRIKQLRRERRARNRTVIELGTPGDRLRARLHERLVDIYTDEIHRRGGELTIEDQFGNVAPLKITDRQYHLALLHAEGWRAYGRAKPRYAQLSYLCGQEDGQTWAVRVPGTIQSITGAVQWVTPAAVHHARISRRRIERQGDVYAIETSKPHDGGGAAELPENHTWDPVTRVLAHPEHRNLHLPYPVRFVRQNVYGMGRGAGRVYGD